MNTVIYSSGLGELGVESKHFIQLVRQMVQLILINYKGCKRRLIYIYVPHGSLSDDEVETTYDPLFGLLAQARVLKRSCWIFGDWNAVAGMRAEGEDAEIVGSFGRAERNARGEWLVSWATMNRLTIANTTFQKRQCQSTHGNGLQKRRIDFGLYERARKYFASNAEAGNDITVGADHRSLKVNFTKREVGARSQRHKRKPKLWGWRPIVHFSISEN